MQDLKIIIKSAALKSAVCGAGTGTMGIAGIFIDNIPVAVIFRRLERDIAGFYGKKINKEPAGIGSAIKYVFFPMAVDELAIAGRKMTLKAMEKYLIEMAAEAGEKDLLRMFCRGASKLVIPISCMVGAIINYYITFKFGKHCVKKYSKEINRSSGKFLMVPHAVPINRN